MSPSRAVSPRPALLDDRSITALQDRLLTWYAEHRRDLPWRRTQDPYAILISEVMLQQTQVARVLPKYEQWLARFPTLESLAAAQLRDVLAAWQGLGYNNRARRLHACATALADDGHPPRLPADLAGLEALPGIGPYTARAVLVFAHNRDVAAVDVNVRRVLTSELALPADVTPRELQTLAETVLPRGRSRDWHNALMDYGAAVLTARAAGVTSRRRQTPFVGSRRWYRARLLRLVLSAGQLGVADLAAALDLPLADVDALVGLMERDGLVRREPDGVRIV